MNLILAFLGAIGVWCMWSALAHPLVRQKSSGESLADARARARLEENLHLSLLADRPLLDRLIGPTLQQAAELLGHLFKHEDRDAMRIAQAGHPARYRTVYDFYAWKVIAALVLFLGGLLNAVVWGTGILPIAFGLGIVGLYLPDYHLSQLIRKRYTLMRTEMAFVLHRLAIHLTAGQNLAQAVKNVVSTNPASSTGTKGMEFKQALLTVSNQPGGPFIGDLRQALAHYNTGQPMRTAIEVMRERNPNMDVIERFVALVQRADELGQPLSAALQHMGTNLQKQLESEMEAQGLVTSVKMILPIGLLVLPAIGIVVLGPAVYLAAQYFLR